MKRLILSTLTSVGLICLAGQAQASWNDGCCMPIQNDCCCANFDGFYVGGNVGWAAEDRVWTDRDGWIGDLGGDEVGSLFRTNSGVVGGVQAGYNWQCGCSLLGIEADWSWGSLKRSRDFDVAAPAPLTLEDRTQWFGTIRGRAGIIASNLLLYATAGAAFAQFKHTWTGVSDVTTESFSTRHTQWGLAAGAGAEWAFNDCISIKAEGLYLKFPERTKSVFSPSSDALDRFSFNETMWLARVGVNFRFSTFCCW